MVIQTPTINPLQALSAFAITFAMGALTTLCVQQYGRMCADAIREGRQVPPSATE